MAINLERSVQKMNSILDADSERILAEKIVASLIDLPKDQSCYLSYSSIANLGGVSPGDGIVIKLLSILTSESLNILRIFYIFETDEGGEHRASPEELITAARDGYFVDPSTGNRVYEYKSRLFPYFERVN